MMKFKEMLKCILPNRAIKIMAEIKFRFRQMIGPPPHHEFSNYDDYWEQRKKVGTIVRRWRVASSTVSDDSSLLDIGCGSGEFLDFLQSEHQGLKLEGADFSSVAVESIKAMGFNARLLNLQTDTVHEKYDFITCFEVIEHIADAELALRNIKNAFRKTLIISIPNIGYIGCRMRLALCGRFPTTMCIYHIKEHVRHWTTKDFREWMAREGLRVVRIEGQYGPSWLPWEKWPGLFASGLVYFIEHSDDKKA